VNIKRALLMSGACGILATAVSTALAQDTSEVAEVVIVTGSYIRGTAEDAALPVDVISSDELEKIGSPTTLELIKGLTVSNGVLGDTNQFDSRAQGNEGAGSINLRGLGRERTLVLLNGRRLVNNGFTGAVDTNLIPTAAIGRIEVLKDGAAATYGSDAIAGVVNFITRENLNGIEIGGDYSDIQGSDGNYTASLAWGWKGESTSLLIAGGYQHRSELPVLERDWAFPDFTQSPESGWSGAGNPSGYVLRGPVGPGGATITTGTLRDPACAGLGGVPTGGVQTSAGPPAVFSFPLCNWQYTKYDNLTEEENRYQVFAQLKQDIGESVEFHVEGLFAETDVPEWKTSPSYAVLQPAIVIPNPAGGAPLFSGYTVSAQNPGVQAFIAAHPTITTVQGLTAPSAALMGSGVFLPGSTFRPYALGGNPLFGNGPSEGERNYKGSRLSLGLSGDVGDSFGWDVAATYMEEKARRTGRDTLVSRLQRALNGLGGPDCAAGSAPGSAGCLWYNPFANGIVGNGVTGAANPEFADAGDNRNPELIDWLFPNGFTETTTETLVFDAVVNGRTGWQLGGGNVGWALGGQYRENKRDTQVDDFTNLEITPCPNSVDGGAGCAPGQPATGPFVFLGGAFEQELKQDVYAVFGEVHLPILDNFEAQIAARFEDYGGRVGNTFDPKLSLRWQVADWLALRGSVGTTFRGPPENQLAEGSVTSLQNIAGTFRAVDTFGNPDLEPESAETFNVGMIVRAGAFSASLDYWNFDFDNPIVIEPVGGIVTAMFPGGANPAAPNNCGVAGFENLQARFTFNGACAPANIARLSVGYVNGAPVKTDGIDGSFQYDFDGVLGGSLGLGLNMTYVLSYEIDPTVVEGVTVARAFDAVGLLNYQTTTVPLPEWKANAFIEYSAGAHNLRFTTNYIDGYTDQRTLAVNPTLGKNIDEFITYDLNYRVELPWQMRLIASVENLTDEDPPFVRLELAYDPFTASAIGRVYKLGLTKRFGAE
jgi:iron complex outermembrane receptor protein